MQKEVSNSIHSSPFLLQIAKDGKWEDTWSLKPSESNELLDFENYLGSSIYKTVAIEVLFHENDGVMILGLDYNEHLLVKSATQFLHEVAIETGRFQSFPDFMHRLDTKLVGKQYLLQGEPDLIRIGVVNHWFSVGPCLIWQKGWEKVISDEILEKRLLENPRVIKTPLNYQGMSFVYNLAESSPGLCHWMKSPCSKHIDDNWVLDRQMIIKYLHDWQNFLITKRFV